MLAAKRYAGLYYLFNINKTKVIFFLRPFSAYPLPLNIDSPSPSPTHHDHKTLCFSLADNLIHRGLVSSAQGVIDRMIKNTSSFPDFIPTINFAISRGLTLNSVSFSSLIKRLTESKQPSLAEELFNGTILTEGIEPIPSILDSMVLCYCKLGKLTEAVSCLEKVVGQFDSIDCKSSYNALLYSLCTGERTREAFNLFNIMSGVGIYPGYSCYSLLIDELCYRGDLDAAHHVFKELTRSATRLSVHLYKSLVYAFCKGQRIAEAESLCREMESYGLAPDQVMYTSLIYGYCREGNIRLAMHVFLRMLKVGCMPDAYCCNTLVYGICRADCVDSVWKLMWNSGWQPNAVTYGIMINKYCKDHKVDCALKLLDCMFSSNVVPTVHCYTVLISALLKEKRHNEAYGLFDKMLETDVAPDHVIFLSLVKDLGKGNAVPLAICILQAVTKRECHIGLHLSSDSFNFPSNKILDEDVKLIFCNILESNSYFANDILIAALCADGRSNIARWCVDKMRAHGRKPLRSTYNSMIKSFCEQRDFLSTFEVLEEMDERGMTPSVAIYDSIINALCNEKRLVKADSIFRKMLKAGVAADEIVYTTLINGYSKNGRPISALRLFGEMIDSGIQPSAHAYGALINGLVKKNRTEEACCYLGRMLKDGFVPDTVLYTILINQFCKKGDISFAFRLAGLMDRNRIGRDLITYGSLISGVCRNISRSFQRYDINDIRSDKAKDLLCHLLVGGQRKRKDYIQRIHCHSSGKMIKITLKEIKDMQQKGLMPDLYIYNAMINGFCRAGKMLDAYECLDYMLKEGMDPNKVTYTTLINGHIRSGEVDYAIQLFDMMNTHSCLPDAITYNALIRGLCDIYLRHCDPESCEDAYKLCEEMLHQGYAPSCFNYNRVLRILSEQNKLGESQKLIEMMLNRGKAPDDGVRRQIIEACYKHRKCEVASALEELLLDLVTDLHTIFKGQSFLSFKHASKTFFAVF